MKKIILIIAISLFWTFAAKAEVPINPSPEKATLCSACHGKEGISVNPQWPNLAGQHKAYLVKQLQDIKKGKTRQSPTMVPIVATLTDADFQALSAFYASLKGATLRVPEKYLKRGEALYRGGDLEKHISACIACHGPNGRGNKEAGFPAVSGQPAPYLIAQLEAFKNKTRSNDYNGIMRDISVRMDKEDMEAVAYYMQGLY